MNSATDIVWLTGRLKLVIYIDECGHALLHSILPIDASSGLTEPLLRDSALPLAEIKLGGESNRFETGKRHVRTYCGQRLLYRHHREHSKENINYLDVMLYDPEARVAVTVQFSAYSDVAAIRSTVNVQNDSKEDIVLRMVSSLVFSGFTSPQWWKDYSVSFAYNTWFREAQWQTLSLPSVGLDDIGITELDYESSQYCYAISNQGSFSTGSNLAMGALIRNDGSQTWLWQIETNSPWRWEIGDFRDSLYIFASGPTDQDHQWSRTLAPQESFTSVPVALCVMHDGLTKAFSEMCHYRRKIIRPHKENERMSVIFNDYMNCLMGDPTEEKLLALIPRAASVGAEYFCIDAGWYSESGDWWASVGEWKPSQSRFPSGLRSVITKIQEAGMSPGLWLEPEVVGVNCRELDDLPPEAFFQRNGARVLEKDRYHLDFQHPAVIARMDAIIDSLINDLGIRYFKFDYNVNVPHGTDTHSGSPGDGQLSHSRAYVSWLRTLIDRHPDLIIENCSSGGQRMDYAMLSICAMQSTSDQQDPIRYAAIAASIMTAVIPEQSATWAYPQPHWSNEVNAFSVVNSLLGRVHLSGRIDQLNECQLELVAEGIEVYKDIRQNLRLGTPFWPLGLPTWADEWVAVGIRCTEQLSYISVWRRSSTASASVDLFIPKAAGIKAILTVLYPAQFSTEALWDEGRGCISVELSSAPAARLLRLEF
ncbi:putative Melibiase subfamily [Xylogone sp. PMI_703]|nr:putative Melibiase subfamily [Xylogone sp. PMI_703]